jgi:glucosamine 6-phosphate synthetase-like amidotransferase/phosphosugar isomerase protein
MTTTYLLIAYNKLISKVEAADMHEALATLNVEDRDCVIAITEDVARAIGILDTLEI